MLTIQYINNRLKENISEEEQSFLYDQLWEMKMIAQEINSSAIEIMNGGKQHA